VLIIAIAVICVGLLGLGTNTVYEFEQNKSNAISDTVILDSKTSILVPETIKIEPIEMTSSHQTEVFPDIETQSNNLLYAHAISSTTTSVTIKEWSIPQLNAFPSAVVVDSSDNVFFTETSAGRIGKLNPTTNTITEWKHPFDFGNAKPTGIGVDSSGNVFYVERPAQGDIARLNTATDVVTLWSGVFSPGCKDFGGTDPAKWAKCESILDVDSSGNVWVTDMVNEKIVRLNPSTNAVTKWSSTDSGMNVPSAVTLDSSGNVYFTGTGGGIVGKLVPSTNAMTEWTLSGAGFGLGERHLAVDSSGNLFVSGDHRGSGGSLPSETQFYILRINTSTDVQTKWNIPSEIVPYGLDIDSNDIVYFAEKSGDRIGRLVPTTNIITEWTIPTSSSSPLDVAVDSSDNVYYVGSTSNKIGRLN